MVIHCPEKLSNDSHAHRTPVLLALDGDLDVAIPDDDVDAIVGAGTRQLGMVAEVAAEAAELQLKVLPRQSFPLCCSHEGSMAALAPRRKKAPGIAPRGFW